MGTCCFHLVLLSLQGCFVQSKKIHCAEPMINGLPCWRDAITLTLPPPILPFRLCHPDETRGELVASIVDRLSSLQSCLVDLLRAIKKIQCREPLTNDHLQWRDSIAFFPLLTPFRQLHTDRTRRELLVECHQRQAFFFARLPCSERKDTLPGHFINSHLHGREAILFSPPLWASQMSRF